ncbi:MAG: ABC transporter substrate-binding protein [Chloroflexi bacterium]|nr:ABC transporter substrate-binding protein [Chloroflexota bacterium]
MFWKRSAAVFTLLGLLIVLLLLAACTRQPAKEAPKAPQPAAPAPAVQTPRAPAPTPSGPAEYTSLIGKLECPLCEPGLEKDHPNLAKYHWSKLPRPIPSVKYGGTLRLDLRYDPVANWDAATGSVGTFVQYGLALSKTIAHDMSLETMFATNGDSNFNVYSFCDLCETWKYEGPSKIVMTLKKGVKWHNIPPVNGREFIADDVKFAYEQFRDPKYLQQNALFQDVASIETPDKYTVILNLKGPNVGFVASLTHPIYSIWSREAFEKEGGLRKGPPIGTGPFMLDQEIPQNKLTWKKNPDYYRKDMFGNKLPYLDRVEMIFMPDPATLTAAWRTGQVDQITTPTWDLVEDIMRTDESGKTAFLRVMQYPTTGQWYFEMQLREPPFNDVKVRRALSMALDRPKMIILVAKAGHCSYGVASIWVGWGGRPPGCDQLGPWYKYNPAQAKALLKEAGFDEANPLKFTLHTSTDSFYVRQRGMAEAAQQMWKDIGVEATIRTYNVTELQSLRFGKKYQGILGGVFPPAGLDLDPQVFFIHSKTAANFAGVNDPVLDQLAEAQRRELDNAKRVEIAKQFAARELDQVSRMWAVIGYYAEWTKPYVRNWVSHELSQFMWGYGSHNIATVWLDK